MSYEVQNFQEDVIDASRKTPVLVDFWAPWCGPCQVLGPVLEKLAEEQDDQWKLAKVDTDENPEISMQFGIRGIPAVKLFIDGEVVNDFTGAMPEHLLRKWLDDALPSESKALLTEAEELLASGDEAGAATRLEEILKSTPGHAIASGLLAQILAFEDTERALALATLAATEPKFATVANAIIQLDESRLKHSAPDDIENEAGKEHYLKASMALANQEFENVIESIIEVLKVNRYLDDDGARKMGIALFVLLGEAHPLTRKYRRTFDMWLY